MNQKKLNAGAFVLSRRDFLHISAATLLTTVFGGLVGCGPTKPLKIAAQVWPGYSFLFLARDQGFISEKAIELIVTENLGVSSSALAKGEVDGAALTLDEVVHLLDQGVSLQVVLILDSSAGADAVMVKPEIKKLASLKGKSIGVESSTLGAIMLSKLLDASHLKTDDINIVTIGFDHLKSWGDQKLDAIITYDPIANLLEQKGLVRIWDSRDIPGLIVDVLAFRSEAVEKHSSALVEIVAGHFKAQILWQKNLIDTAYLLAKTLQTTSDQIKNIFMGLDLPDARFNRHILTPPTSELQKTVAEIAQIMVNAKLIRQIPSIDNLFTADFLPGDL